MNLKWEGFLQQHEYSLRAPDVSIFLRNRNATSGHALDKASTVWYAELDFADIKRPREFTGYGTLQEVKLEALKILNDYYMAHAVECVTLSKLVQADILETKMLT